MFRENLLWDTFHILKHPVKIRWNSVREKGCSSEQIWIQRRNWKVVKMLMLPISRMKDITPLDVIEDLEVPDLGFFSRWGTGYKTALLCERILNAHGSSELLKVNRSNLRIAIMEVVIDPLDCRMSMYTIFRPHRKRKKIRTFDPDPVGSIGLSKRPRPPSNRYTNPPEMVETPANDTKRRTI